MRCPSVPGRIALLAIACSTAGASGPQANLSDRPAATPGLTDFKVVVWYRRAQPLDTFKYQVYDLRKGQYTPAVDVWIQLLRTKYPGYDVTIREVDLAREQGETESLKVGSVIKHELMAAAALEGIVIGDTVPGLQVRTIVPRTGLPAAQGMIGRPAPLGASFRGSNELNPPGPSFPVPVPYPRPHP
ncbi:MAG: hypothetical protein WBX00_32810 [Isosphaeraceae bacterium]